MPTELTPAPTLRARVRELLVEKFGSLRCHHQYTLVVRKGAMYLRCVDCAHETEPFRVAGKP